MRNAASRNYFKTALALFNIAAVATLLLEATLPTRVSAVAQLPGGFSAGASRVEITPPPGLATGGHGPAGAIARGQLTRLYGRAIFLRDARSNPLLLLSVESFAVPQIFREEVVREFRKRKISLPESAVIVSATHTHQGPGNYLSAEAYNHLGSRLAGYVPDLRRFLVQQLVKAALDAEHASRTTGNVTIRLRVGTLPFEVLRNRSPRTFMLNRDAAEIMGRLNPDGPATAAECMKARLIGEPEDDWAITGCPRLRAVDRSVRVLDIEKDGRSIANLVFAAFHPTVLPTDTPLYSSDFAGLSMRWLEASRGDDFVAAFFNGAEGDISSRRTRRDIHDLWKHAEVLHRVIATSNGQQIDLSRGIETRSHWAIPGDAIGSPPVARLAKRARGGAAALGGAEGDRTILYSLGWQERVTADRADDEHGAKLNPLDSNLIRILPDLTGALLASSPQFPHALPLSYARLGELEMFSAPTEMSTAIGQRIAELGDKRNLTVVLGLANEYASYTASEEEYTRQDYMGASTLWGPMQGRFFNRVLGQLKSGSAPPSKSKAVDRPGLRSLSLVPYRVGATRVNLDDDLDLVLHDVHGNPVRNLPSFTWRECGSSDPYKNTSARRIRIMNGNDLVDDDAFGRILIVLEATPVERTSEWVAFWAGPLAATRWPTRVRFVAHGADGRVHESAAFSPAQDHGNRGTGAPCPTD